jgi:fission process protein 1
METNGETDIWRKTWVRYLGYANEVGEAFGPIYPKYVRPSYFVAFGYVGCDTVDKTWKAYNSKSCDSKQVVTTAFDTLLWQTLASVLIPGQVIRLIASTTQSLCSMPKLVTFLHPKVLRYTPTCIGLGAIPFIIHPIDQSVDYLFDNYIRKFY